MDFGSTGDGAVQDKLGLPEFKLNLFQVVGCNTIKTKIMSNRAMMGLKVVQHKGIKMGMIHDYQKTPTDN